MTLNLNFDETEYIK